MFARGVYAYEWPTVALNILGRGCSVGCLSLCYVLAAEVFPTVTRNVGIGSSSVWVGGIKTILYNVHTTLHISILECIRLILDWSCRQGLGP